MVDLGGSFSFLRDDDDDDDDAGAGRPKALGSSPHGSARACQHGLRGPFQMKMSPLLYRSRTVFMNSRFIFRAIAASSNFGGVAAEEVEVEVEAAIAEPGLEVWVWDEACACFLLLRFCSARTTPRAMSARTGTRRR